jgi:signal transduction histidine kinase
VRAFSLPSQCVGLIFDDVIEHRGPSEAHAQPQKKPGFRARDRANRIFEAKHELKSLVPERRRAEDQLRDALSVLHQLTARLMSAREDERARVARAMHDELGQAYTALKMDLSWIDQRLPRSATVLHERTAIMRRLIEDTIVRMRRIATELRPSTLDELGLADAIEWQAQEFEAHTGIHCQVRVPRQELLLDEQQATALFRIFQEALTNVARHAGATEVHARLGKYSNRLTLIVRDNGKGFEEPKGNGEKSLGLLGMRERTLLVSGKFSIRGVPGKGTVVRVSVPLNAGRAGENSE